ncbi:hypothetical protein SAMN05720606_103135 [Paenibacillus polysaccharolyticus]|uniref:Uncharacterized protein n=1 Tax=Paenibacillus polysaccharolyticus TaxID=582692 RepID=A0A1G5E4A2_9BACL|nr:DUF6025 family protein [Paenibacillus polysaccharolyticus]SCY21348.1 hypothetical protein SAMN05720606_103135 [Paenibacillus polysaccharolyticus]
MKKILSSNIVENVIELLSESYPNLLNLSDRYQASCFDWVHLGNSDIEVGKVLDFIRKSPELVPPRTGHLGNWDPIIEGRAGALDFNKVICDNKFGYPLIYCFNQTEDVELNQGDAVYLPGSKIEGNNRVLLPLYTWNGEQFIERDRTIPLFTPFVFTKVKGKMQSLANFHLNRCKDLNQYEFRSEANIIYSQKDLVKKLLYVLMEDAENQINSKRAFQNLFSHVATLEGTIKRADILVDSNGYRMGEAYFKNKDEFIQSAMIPFQAVVDSCNFVSNLHQLPNHVPIISNILSGVLSAIFHSHYSSSSVQRDCMTQPFNPHFHWGARDMAGYPPRRKGYFAEKSTTKSYKKILQVIVRHFPEVDPVLLVLLPSSIFMLWPVDLYRYDLSAVEELLEDVIESGDSYENMEQMHSHINKMVERWFEKHKYDISTYFLNRFYPGSGIPYGRNTHNFSNPVEPMQFRKLTFRQACMIVGCLMEIVPKKEKKV